MKKINKHVQATIDQIENTLLMLDRYGLVLDWNRSDFRERKELCHISWPSHQRGRLNCGSNFTSLEQYIWIIDSGAYQCILFDGSIIRASLSFSKNILIGESLLYWPAPFSFTMEEVNEFGIEEVVSAKIGKKEGLLKELNMRTPLRIDYDPSKKGDINHPAAHIHLQDAECRMGINKPCCFNTFLHFVLSNFYASKCKYILKELHPLFYSGFEENQSAPIKVTGLHY